MDQVMYILTILSLVIILLTLHGRTHELFLGDGIAKLGVSLSDFLTKSASFARGISRIGGMHKVKTLVSATDLAETLPAASRLTGTTAGATEAAARITNKLESSIDALKSGTATWNKTVDDIVDKVKADKALAKDVKKYGLPPTVTETLFAKTEGVLNSTSKWADAAKALDIRHTGAPRTLLDRISWVKTYAIGGLTMFLIAFELKDIIESMKRNGGNSNGDSGSGDGSGVTTTTFLLWGVVIGGVCCVCVGMGLLLFFLQQQQ